MSLRLLELYASYQGEGPNTGRPTVFVRFAGCNLKCPGWPCDTQHAIDPKLFNGKQEFISGEDLAKRILNTFPTIQNVCLTGGEPFLQNYSQMMILMSELKDMSYDIEVFTNGQLPWKAATEFVDNFIWDWKLPGSGESTGEKRNSFEDSTEYANLQKMGEPDAVKFTIRDTIDYDVAVRRYHDHIQAMTRAPVVYCGIVWNGDWTTEQLCARMLHDELPWRLNVQVHKFVWDPNKQGV